MRPASYAILLLAIHCLLETVPLCAQYPESDEAGVHNNIETLDLDVWLRARDEGEAGYCCECCTPNYHSPWTWQVLPSGFIYGTYLAGVHEPRMSIIGQEDADLGWTWDSTIGGRVGLLRYGTPGPAGVQGVQLDIDAAVFVRQDDQEELVGTDFRVGLPLSYAIGRYQTKFGYYHLSSHIGDEFLINSSPPRINFVRDSIVWGHSYYLWDPLRLYFEVGYAFSTDGGSRPWEFQFGIDYSPRCATGLHGSPFAAVNAHLRQEVDFGGNFVAQAGWQWRGNSCSRLIRTGVHYYNGKSPQFQFFDRFEQQIGVGIWYDF